MAIVNSEAEIIQLIERALGQTASIIAAIAPTQARLATVCPAWDVRALVQHVVCQDLRNFTVSARGESADWQAPADSLGDDWAAVFRERAADLLDVWRAADLDQQVPTIGGGHTALRSRASQQIAELATHGWDLAKATGQNADLDPTLAEHALDWSRGMLRPEFRGPDQAFGLEVPVPADAPVYDRLAGWFGRDPSWSQSAHDPAY